MRRRLPPHLVLKERTRKTGRRKGEPGKRNVWIIRDGAHRQSTGCGEHDLEGAQQALSIYIAAKYLPPTGLGPRLLIDEVMAAYLKGRANTSPSRDWLVHTARPVLEWWTGKRVGDVTRTNCKAYVDWRTSQNIKRHPNSKKPPVKVSDQTARHDLKTLRAALNWYKSEHDPQLVVPTVTLPKKAPARKNYWLSRDEVARRLRLARKHGQTRHICRLLLIGVYSGTRPGAMLGLRWLPSPTSGWVDLESGTLHRAGTAERETNKRKPPVRIHAKLLPHLRRWHRHDTKHGITYVVHYLGAPIRKLRRAWASVGGGNDGPHICRHTAATWLMQGRVDIYEAAGYLGMTPETLWSTYGHHHPDFQRSAATSTGKRKRG